MGSLVHTGLGSSSLVAHVLPYPPPPSTSGEHPADSASGPLDAHMPTTKFKVPSTSTTNNKDSFADVAFADDNDCYIKSKLSVALEVLSDIKHVLKEDVGLDLDFDKTKILVKGISVTDAHAAGHLMFNEDQSLMMMPFICSCRNKK
jgi:hypothetical protein